MRQGAADIEAERETKHSRLLHAITYAEAVAEERITLSFVAATTTDWRAASAWLERRRPDSWSASSKLTVDLAVTVNANELVKDPEVMAAARGLRDLLAQRSRTDADAAADEK